MPLLLQMTIGLQVINIIVIGLTSFFIILRLMTNDIVYCKINEQDAEYLIEGLTRESFVGYRCRVQDR